MHRAHQGSPCGCRAFLRCMLPVSTEAWCSRTILLDYRKRAFDGSFYYGDGCNVSEKGVQTFNMSKTLLWNDEDGGPRWRCPLALTMMLPVLAIAVKGSRIFQDSLLPSLVAFVSFTRASWSVHGDAHGSFVPIFTLSLDNLRHSTPLYMNLHKCCFADALLLRLLSFHHLGAVIGREIMDVDADISI